jgi:hypothetical protein
MCNKRKITLLPHRSPRKLRRRVRCRHTPTRASQAYIRARRRNASLQCHSFCRCWVAVYHRRILHRVHADTRLGVARNRTCGRFGLRVITRGCWNRQYLHRRSRGASTSCANRDGYRRRGGTCVAVLHCRSVALRNTGWLGSTPRAASLSDGHGLCLQACRTDVDKAGDVDSRGGNSHDGDSGLGLGD